MILVVNLAAVHLLDRASVQAEQVDPVLVDQFEDWLEVFGRIESDPHLDREKAVDRIAQGAQDGVDLDRIAQESSADILVVHLGRGASHIEVDAGHLVARVRSPFV